MIDIMKQFLGRRISRNHFNRTAARIMCTLLSTSYSLQMLSNSFGPQVTFEEEGQPGFVGSPRFTRIEGLLPIERQPSLVT